MNQGAYRWKISQLDYFVNIVTIWNIFLIFVLAGSMTSGTAKFVKRYYSTKTGEGAFYIFQDSENNYAALAFGSYYLLFN